MLHRRFASRLSLFVTTAGKLLIAMCTTGANASFCQGLGLQLPTRGKLNSSHV